MTRLYWNCWQEAEKVASIGASSRSGGGILQLLSRWSNHLTKRALYCHKNPEAKALHYELTLTCCCCIKLLAGI